MKSFYDLILSWKWRLKPEFVVAWAKKTKSFDWWQPKKVSTWVTSHHVNCLDTGSQTSLRSTEYRLLTRTDTNNAGDKIQYFWWWSDSIVACHTPMCTVLLYFLPSWSRILVVSDHYLWCDILVAWPHTRHSSICIPFSILTTYLI